MRSVTITRAARSAHVASLGLVCVLAGACMREPIQLGEGRQTDSGITGDASPLAQDGGAITPALPVTDLALGGETSCALLADGRVACWGADDFGELAIDPDVSLMRPSACGERRCLRTPAVSPYLSGVVELGLGAHFGCARTSRGAVSCWGDNRFGQLGRGTGGSDERHPRPVEIASDAVELAVGRYHACVRDAAGIVRCWGLAEHGRLGREATERCAFPTDIDPSEIGLPEGTRDVACSSTPAEVEGLGAVEDIAAGRDHTCALHAGEVLCWGRDDRGQLGDGVIGGDRTAPVHVTNGVGPLRNVKVIALGAGTSFAISSDGVLASWGEGTWGQLAIEPDELEPCDDGRCAPAPRMRAAPFTRLSVGRAHACGLDASGRVSCWGHALDGLLGTGAVDRCDPAQCVVDPVEVTALGAGVRAVAVADAHACALLFPENDVPSVYCWGTNSAGQLGLGTHGSPVTTPMPVASTR